MRKSFQMFAILLFTAAATQAQTPAPDAKAPASSTSPAVLADGTLVKLRVGAGINVASVRVGDELDLDVAEEIQVRDVAIVPTSSSARVVVATENLEASKTGKALVSLRYVLLCDGEKVSLRPTPERKTGAPKTVMLSATEGDVTISNGAEIVAYINGNLPLDIPKMRLASQPTNELKITSTPGNAEVSVDGKVLGSTPFSGRVVRGEHVVTLRMAGFQPWRQKVNVSNDAANLQVALKKQDGLETVPQASVAPASLGDLARAARAKKSTDDAPKASGEPLELLPGETRTTNVPASTPQSPSAAPAPGTAPAPAAQN
jgi:hypothetical protein